MDPNLNNQISVEPNPKDNDSVNTDSHRDVGAETKNTPKGKSAMHAKKLKNMKKTMTFLGNVDNENY